MDIASPQEVLDVSAGPGPAFHKRWNGWTVAAALVLLAVLYIIVQLAATVVWLFIAFPDVMAQATRGNPTALMHLARPEGLAQVLTPVGFLAIQLPTTAVMMAATFGLAYGLLRPQATLKDLGFGRPLTSGNAAFAVGAGVVLFIVAGIIEFVQERIFGPHPQQIALILEQHRGVLALVLDLLSAAVLAPLWEETLFRGLLFTSFVQRMPFWWAATLSGLLFALGHVDKWNILPLWLLGIGLAYVYYRTGNIWANIVTHATINGIDLLLPLLVPQLAGK
jgi:membrane protease YdiL (CAAX protease family)